MVLAKILRGKTPVNLTQIKEQLQNTWPLMPSLNLLFLWPAVRSQLASLYVFTKCLTEVLPWSAVP